MIKYLGSKRRLVDPIVALAGAVIPDEATASDHAWPALLSAPGSGTSLATHRRPTALDLFSGTARVGRRLKQAGFHVTAVDSATYAHVLAETYVSTDARAIDTAALQRAIDGLNELPGRRGYVTEVFCEEARFFHPDNGQRIDAIRDAIEDGWADSPLYPVLLTSLLEGADRVDSTTGLQMAYLKEWAPRALRPLELRVPALEPGTGTALLSDAEGFVGGQSGAVGSGAGQPGTEGSGADQPGTEGSGGGQPGTEGSGGGQPGTTYDVAYLDPPYNQHRYFTNYHVWETLVRWDAPEHYGIACKRLDCRDDVTASPFNRRREMPAALASVIAGIDCELLLVSYNDESWLSVADLVAMCETSLSRRAQTDGTVAVLGIDQPRYVGARIGIHNPAGEKVGRVSHVRNTEMIVAAGPTGVVERAISQGLRVAAEAGLLARVIDASASSSSSSRPSAKPSARPIAKPSARPSARPSTGPGDASAGVAGIAGPPGTGVPSAAATQSPAAGATPTPRPTDEAPFPAPV